MINTFKLLCSHFTFGLENGKTVAYLNENLWSVFGAKPETNSVATAARATVETLTMNPAINAVFSGKMTKVEDTRSAVYDHATEELYELFVGAHKVLEIRSQIIPGFSPEELELSDALMMLTAQAASEQVNNYVTLASGVQTNFIDPTTGESITAQTIIHELEKFFISLNLQNENSQIGVFAFQTEDQALKFAVLNNHDPEFVLTLVLDCSLA